MFKRRITVDQLREFTPEQQEKLREWWEPQEGDFIISGHDDRIRVISNINKSFADEYFLGADINYSTDIVRLADCLPLPDISMMIELLDPKEEKIFTMCNYIAADPRTYEITANGSYYHGDTMCDALFAAVKAIL